MYVILISSIVCIEILCMYGCITETIATTHDLYHTKKKIFCKT